MADHTEARWTENGQEYAHCACNMLRIDGLTEEYARSYLERSYGHGCQMPVRLDADSLCFAVVEKFEFTVHDDRFQADMDVRIKPESELTKREVWTLNYWQRCSEQEKQRD